MWQGPNTSRANAISSARIVRLAAAAGSASPCPAARECAASTFPLTARCGRHTAVSALADGRDGCRAADSHAPGRASETPWRCQRAQPWAGPQSAKEAESPAPLAMPFSASPRARGQARPRLYRVGRARSGTRPRRGCPRPSPVSATGDRPACAPLRPPLSSPPACGPSGEHRAATTSSGCPAPGETVAPPPRHLRGRAQLRQPASPPRAGARR
jgi:hypothetical protein